LAVLVIVSTQALPHAVIPALHEALHSPDEHTSPAPHATSHEPQCAASAVVSTQASPQRTNVGSQTMSHPAMVQAGAPFAGASQDVSHPPQ
jgi:hypothetical protein